MHFSGHYLGPKSPILGTILALVLCFLEALLANFGHLCEPAVTRFFDAFFWSLPGPKKSDRGDHSGPCFVLSGVLSLVTEGFSGGKKNISSEYPV